MTPAAQMSELGYTSLLMTSGAMNLWQERQPRSVSSTDLPKCMEALQCSNAVTIETVVCRLNLNHGGMTYAMHQGCFLCVVDLAVCAYISHWWGLVPQLKSESAPLHDSKSIARVTRWPQEHSATNSPEIMNARKFSGTASQLIVQHVFHSTAAPAHCTDIAHHVAINAASEQKQKTDQGVPSSPRSVRGKLDGS